MAKQENQEKTKLQEALEQQKKAEQKYGNLVRRSTTKMDDKQKQQHLEACRKALEEKRQAQQAVRNLKAGKI